MSVAEAWNSCRADLTSRAVLYVHKYDCGSIVCANLCVAIRGVQSIISISHSLTLSLACSRTLSHRCAGGAAVVHPRQHQCVRAAGQGRAHLGRQQQQVCKSLRVHYPNSSRTFCSHERILSPALITTAVGGISKHYMTGCTLQHSVSFVSRCQQGRLPASVPQSSKAWSECRPSACMHAR